MALATESNKGHLQGCHFELTINNITSSFEIAISIISDPFLKGRTLSISKQTLCCMKEDIEEIYILANNHAFNLYLIIYSTFYVLLQPAAISN